MDRAKILEAVLNLDQAKKCIREHIDKLDKTSVSDMFEAGALCEDCVLIASILDDLLEWREQRWQEGRRRRSAALTRSPLRWTRSTSTASSRAAS